MKIDFEYDFPGYILERGYELYKKDKIRKVDRINNTIKAKIHDGKNYYKPEVRIKNGNVIYHKCNCSYYDKYHECSHVVGLLWYLANSRVRSENMMKSFERVSDKKLREYVFSLINSNNNFYEDFRRKFPSKFSVASVDNYCEAISEIVNEEVDNADNDYYLVNFERLNTKLKKYIDEVYYLIEKKEYELSFSIVTHILDELLPVFNNIDDSEIMKDDTYIVKKACRVLGKIMRKSKDEFLLERIWGYLAYDKTEKILITLGIDPITYLDYFKDNKNFNYAFENYLYRRIEDAEDNENKKTRRINRLADFYEIKGYQNKLKQLLDDNLDKPLIFKRYFKKYIKPDTIVKQLSFLDSARRDNPKLNNCILNLLFQICENGIYQ